MKKYVIAKLRAQPKNLIGGLTVFRIGKAKDVRFSKRIYYIDGKKLYLNVCTPLKSYKRLPVFIYLHGGGWVSGSPQSRISFVSNIAAYGYATFCIFYGYAPQNGHPTAIQNIYHALDYILNNKDYYNIDINRIFVGGESAGAYLSAMLGAISSNQEYKQSFDLCQNSKDLTFCGLVLNCGVYDLDTAILSDFKHITSYVGAYYGKSIEDFKSDNNTRFLSPINFVTKDYPKCLLISAQHDKLCAQSYDFAATLNEHNVQNTHFHAVGNAAVHGFAVVQYLKPSKLAMQKIYEFLS